MTVLQHQSLGKNCFRLNLKYKLIVRHFACFKISVQLYWGKKGLQLFFGTGPPITWRRPWITARNSILFKYRLARFMLIDNLRCVCFMICTLGWSSGVWVALKKICVSSVPDMVIMILRSKLFTFSTSVVIQELRRKHSTS